MMTERLKHVTYSIPAQKVVLKEANAIEIQHNMTLRYNILPEKLTVSELIKKYPTF
jgi:hypothetical protein